MTVQKRVLEKIDSMGDEILAFLMDLIRTEPVNPLYDKSGNRSELDCAMLVKQRLETLGLEVEQFDIDLTELEPYKGRPGYIPGYTDTMHYEDRPNLLTRIQGSGGGRSLLLTGHLDVVGVEDENQWVHPPFAPVIEDGIFHGRGSVDMLSGEVAMLMALEALYREGVKLKGDVWFSGIVSEESGGTGGLMLAHRLMKKGVTIDAGIMGEPTDLKLNLLCRGIQKVDVVVHGRTGHLEEPQPHWSEGGSVDAIAKARYILGAIDELNREWAIRPDKNHALLPIPNQVKLALINGGHQRSSYPDRCVLSFNIQVLPHELDDQGSGTSVRAEFNSFLNHVFDTDPWLNEHRPEINWFSESDCSEVPHDHAFVNSFLNSAAPIKPDVSLGACGFHTDTGWFSRLADIPVINFGPGDPSFAHRSNEQCPAQDIITATKMVSLVLMDWCQISEN